MAVGPTRSVCTTGTLSAVLAGRTAAAIGTVVAINTVGTVLTVGTISAVLAISASRTNATGGASFAVDRIAIARKLCDDAATDDAAKKGKS